MTHTSIGGCIDNQIKSAYIKYKCKICGDIYTKCVYKAEVCTETSHNRIITMLQKHGFIPYLNTLN